MFAKAKSSEDNKKKEKITIRSSAAEYLTYIASIGDAETVFEVRYQDENIWLTQKMLSVLYDVKVNTINYHVNKIFEDAELDKNLVIRKFRITASDGKSYDALHYSLQMIIAVGFKVDSERAVQFRKWVNQIAKDYTIKGWVMDDERLKQGTFLTDKYFEEQLERIREIRASERKFYQKITDIYATAIDYDKNAKSTKRFYATVQNKMHFAVHGHTAAELIVERANSEREHMGLTTWRDAPDDKLALPFFNSDNCDGDNFYYSTKGKISNPTRILMVLVGLFFVTSVIWRTDLLYILYFA